MQPPDAADRCDDSDDLFDLEVADCGRPDTGLLPHPLRVEDRHCLEPAEVGLERLLVRADAVRQQISFGVGGPGFRRRRPRIADPAAISLDVFQLFGIFQLLGRNGHVDLQAGILQRLLDLVRRTVSCLNLCRVTLLQIVQGEPGGVGGHGGADEVAEESDVAIRMTVVVQVPPQFAADLIRAQGEVGRRRTRVGEVV
nr:hypothetical protein Ade03nite_66530 [Actinoplanes derwentensis]